MKTRKQVSNFINNQLADYRKFDKHKSNNKERFGVDINDINAFHYGMCELRDLMDFIYGEKFNEDEQILIKD